MYKIIASLDIQNHQECGATFDIYKTLEFKVTESLDSYDDGQCHIQQYFNYIVAWRSVLFVEETRVSRENH